MMDRESPQRSNTSTLTYIQDNTSGLEYELWCITQDFIDNNDSFELHAREITMSSLNLPSPPTPSLENEKSLTPETAKPPKKSLWSGKSSRFWVAFFMLNLTAFISALDAVIIAAALPAITSELGGSSNQAFWSGTAFLLAATITQPLYGTFSEIFGRRNNLMASLTWFLLGSILCARSTYMGMFIGSRVIQGIGGGGMIALVEVTVTDMVGLNERGAFAGIVALSWAFGTVLGPIMGGAIAEHTTWRWVFYINIPVVVIVAIGIWFFLTLRTDSTSIREKLKRVDYLGIVIFVGSATSFLFGLTAGGVIFPWASANVIAPLVIGIFGMVLFWFVEDYIVKEPMMPMRVFKERTAFAGYIGTWVHGIILWSIIYYLLLWAQSVLTHSTLQSGVDALPITLSTAPTAAIAGVVMTLTLRFRPAVWLGWAVTVVSCGLFTLLSPDTTTGQRVGYMILMGIGTGILFPSLQFAAQAGQSDEDVGFATSTFVFIRSLGQTFGVALGGVIFQNQWDKNLAKDIANNSIPTAFQIKGNEAEGAVLFLKQLSPDVLQTVKWLYSDSLRAVWIFFIPLAGIAFLASLFMRNYSLDKVLNSKQAFDETRPASEPSQV